MGERYVKANHRLSFGLHNSSIKSPVGPRSPSPRFGDIPITSLPPLPTRDPRKSPASRPTSPRFSTALPHSLYFDSPIITRDRSKSTEVQRPSPLLVAPIARYDPHPHLRQQDSIQSGSASTSRHRTVTPGDNLYQPLDLTGQITRDDRYLSSGGYGIICVGTWQHGTQSYRVCIAEMHCFDWLSNRNLFRSPSRYSGRMTTMKLSSRSLTR